MGVRKLESICMDDNDDDAGDFAFDYFPTALPMLITLVNRKRRGLHCLSIMRALMMVEMVKGYSLRVFY